MAIKRTSSNSLVNATKMSTGFSSAAIPNTPTIGAATAVDDVSATVAYIAAVLGANGVTFTATSSPSSITGTGSSPITVTGLTASTGYTFTVTSGNANGTSAASSASNSITTSAPVVVGDWDSIATQTVTNSAATAGSNVVNSISFTSIPNTYKHLRIQCTMKDNWNASGSGEMYLFFNSVTTGNPYATHWTQISSTTASSFTLSSRNDGIFFGVIPRNEASTAFGAAMIDIYDYKDTGKAKVVKYISGGEWSGNAATQIGSGLSTNTDTISSIQIYANGYGFQYRSTFALYGMKG